MPKRIYAVKSPPAPVIPVRGDFPEHINAWEHELCGFGAYLPDGSLVVPTPHLPTHVRVFPLPDPWYLVCAVFPADDTGSWVWFATQGVRLTPTDGDYARPMTAQEKNRLTTAAANAGLTLPAILDTFGETIRRLAARNRRASEAPGGFPLARWLTATRGT